MNSTDLSKEIHRILLITCIAMNTDYLFLSLVSGFNQA